MSDEKLKTMKDAVDHLLLGVADLEQGMAWFEKLTGVKAIVGGSHPGVGTRNALVSLGGRQYLELIAPDPAQKAFGFRMDLRKLTEPRLVTWAALTSDIAATTKAAQTAKLTALGPLPGSRMRPDGKMLKWKTLGFTHPFGKADVDPIPFFIEWESDSVHPSQDSPTGCRLQKIEIEHPDASNVTAMLKSVGIQAEVKQSKNARLMAVFETPKGKITL